MEGDGVRGAGQLGRGRGGEGVREDQNLEVEIENRTSTRDDEREKDLPELG